MYHCVQYINCNTNKELDTEFHREFSKIKKLLTEEELIYDHFKSSI